MSLWVDVCGTDDVDRDDVVRFDHGTRTYAVYHTADGGWFATDGLCTHAGVHLSGGFLAGSTIECPKHNGRFDVTTGRATARPALVDLGCHPVRVAGGRVELLVAGAP